MDIILGQIKNALQWLIDKIDSRTETNAAPQPQESMTDEEKTDNKAQQFFNELTFLKTAIQDLQTQYNQLQTQYNRMQTQMNSLQRIITPPPLPKQPQVELEKKEPERETVVSAPVSETFYVKRMDIEGNIEIRNKISPNEAYFELASLGNKAELHPLPTQSAYLIMQSKYLLEPAFAVSGTGGSISVIDPAKYELKEDNVWEMKKKGEIELK